MPEEALVAGTLDHVLLARLREVLAGEPLAESELRALTERTDGWARVLAGRVAAAERRLEALTADADASLADVAAELRLLEELQPALSETRTLLANLEELARRLRTGWLLDRAHAAPSTGAASRTAT